MLEKYPYMPDRIDVQRGSLQIVGVEVEDFDGPKGQHRRGRCPWYPGFMGNMGCQKHEEAKPDWCYVAPWDPS